MEQKSGLSIWAHARDILADALSSDVYERWISVIEVEELRDDSLILSVANDFYHTWLIENYLPLIEGAVSTAASKKLAVEFIVDRSKGKPNPVTAGNEQPGRVAKRPPPKQRFPHPVLNQKYTFDRFIVGPSNNFPHAASLAVAQSPAKAYNPLFLFGDVGLGKTHLMQAIGHQALHDEKLSLRVCYLSTEEFTNEYIDALQRHKLVEFRKKYRSVDLLLIDDIHFLGGKERLQEEFFHTFNALFDNHKQIVMTCDRPASELPGLEQRLVSRFEWGLVAELQAPDVETRIAILRNKQEQLQFEVSDDILKFLAQNIRSNIRRLEGGLIRVASYISLTGRPISIATLEDLLQDTLDKEQREAITIEAIQKVVADYYDIRFGDMTSKRRPQSIAYPRQVAMFLARSLTAHSLPEIGQAFERNHATVLHAYRLVTEKSKADASLRKSLAVLKQRLSQR